MQVATDGQLCHQRDVVVNEASTDEGDDPRVHYAGQNRNLRQQICCSCDIVVVVLRRPGAQSLDHHWAIF